MRKLASTPDRPSPYSLEIIRTMVGPTCPATMSTPYPPPGNTRWRGDSNPSSVILHSSQEISDSRNLPGIAKPISRNQE